MTGFLYFERFVFHFERTILAPENPWRPFCSERCKQIDLGAWASESYRITGQVSDDEAGAPGLEFPDTPTR